MGSRSGSPSRSPNVRKAKLHQQADVSGLHATAIGSMRRHVCIWRVSSSATGLASLILSPLPPRIPLIRAVHPCIRMALTLADVRRIAHLARIEITAEQAQATLAQLNDIFAMIAQMKKWTLPG